MPPETEPMNETAPAPPFRRAHRWLALAAVLVEVLSVCSNISYPRQTDFIAYWAAARLALGGMAAAAYDPTKIAAVQASAAHFTTRMPFGYPPPFLLMILPVGLLPYTAAMAAWVSGSLAAFLAAARRLAPGWTWLAIGFPPVLVNVMIGQNGLLTGALVMMTAASLRRSPFAAGLLAGCLVIKPQLALLYPIAFVAGGQWRAFAGATVSAIGLSAAAWACFGTDAYWAMIGASHVFTSALLAGSSGWHKMASPYAALRLVGMGNGVALAVHIVIALAAAATVVAVWRRRHPPAAMAATLVAASMLVSPYLFVYDTAAIVVPFLWLAREGGNRRVLAALWLLPMVSVVQNWGFYPMIGVMPIVSIGLLVLIVCRLYGQTLRRFESPTGDAHRATNATSGDGAITAMTPSPCTKVCQLDSATGWCRGCGRSGQEIGDWFTASDAEKRAILARLPARLRRLDQ